MAAVQALFGAAIVIVMAFMPLPWMFPVIVAVFLVIWLAFGAPSDCLAVIRGGKTCRNNAKGLLRACHIQQHKRQKSLQLWADGRDFSDVLRSTRNGIEVMAGLAASLTALVTAVGGLLG